MGLIDGVLFIIAFALIGIVVCLAAAIVEIQNDVNDRQYDPIWDIYVDEFEDD